MGEGLHECWLRNDHVILIDLWGQHHSLLELVGPAWVLLLHEEFDHLGVLVGSSGILVRGLQELNSAAILLRDLHLGWLSLLEENLELWSGLFFVFFVVFVVVDAHAFGCVPYIIIIESFINQSNCDDLLALATGELEYLLVIL